MPTTMMVEAGSILLFTIDLIQNPTTTKIAIAPAHQRNGVPIASTSCEQESAPQVFGD